MIRTINKAAYSTMSRTPKYDQLYYSTTPSVVLQNGSMKYQALMQILIVSIYYANVIAYLNVYIKYAPPKTVISFVICELCLQKV